ADVDLPGVKIALCRHIAVDIVVEDAHVPAAAAPLRQAVADPAHADDTERAARQFLAEVPERLPGLPLAGQCVLMPRDDASAGGGSGSGHTSASQASAICRSPTSGICRVTTTFGLPAMASGLR